jgi:hypothetical protein
LANRRSSGHARGRSGYPPATDIRVVTSAFALISSALPPASDVGGTPVGVRLAAVHRTSHLQFQENHCRRTGYVDNSPPRVLAHPHCATTTAYSSRNSMVDPTRTFERTEHQRLPSARIGHSSSLSPTSAFGPHSGRSDNAPQSTRFEPWATVVVVLRAQPARPLVQRRMDRACAH